MILIAVLIPIVIGYLTIDYLVSSSRIPHRIFLHLTMALPVGLAVCSLIIFWAFVIGGGFGKSLSLFLTLGLGLLLLSMKLKERQTRKASFFQFSIVGLPKQVIQAFNPKIRSQKEMIQNSVTAAAFLLFLFYFAHYVNYLVGKESWNILGGWDARYFWNLKARFYFRIASEWRGMFNPVLTWAHPDYPLMLPGAIAWGWIVAGKELLLWPPILDLAFFSALCLLVVWYLGSNTSWVGGFLAASYLTIVYVFRFWSTTQYADVALCLFFTSSAMIFISAVRLSENRLFLFSGFLAGLSSWTKNEGIFFIVWMIVILGIVLWRDKTITRADKRARFLYFATGVIVPLLAVLYSKMFLGLKGGEYLGSGRSLSQYLSLVFGDFEKSRFIAACFWIFKFNFEQWNGLWPLFFAALLLTGRRGLANYRWVFVLLIALIELGYFGVLHTSPSDLQLQLKTSLMRLLLQAAAMALVFTFEAVGPLFPALKNNQTP